MEKYMRFRDEIAKLNEQLKDMQALETIEQVEDTDALAALVVLNSIKYEKVTDVFLAVASVNLLNRYVKQPQAKIGYRFKAHITDVLWGIEHINQSGSILVSYALNSKTMLIIQFWNFQFSFHSIKLTKKIKKLTCSNPLAWDSIKKQPFSKTIFYYALENSWSSNLTMKNTNLRELIRNVQLDFKEGEYNTFSEQLIKYMI